VHLRRLRREEQRAHEPVRVAAAQLERDLIRERVKAGLRNAKLKGKILGRPTLILDRDRIARLRASGASIREIAAQLEVSTATVHSVLRQR